MSLSRLVKWPLLCAAVLPLAVLGLRSASSPPATPNAADRIRADRPECPHAWDTIPPAPLVRGDSSPIPAPHTLIRPGGFAASGRRTHIPEYNDCQHFVIGGRYAPMVAVFASQYLRDSIFPPNRETTPTQVYAAAEVFVYSRAFRYSPLGLKPYMNCLYVWGSYSSLHATMVWEGSNDDTPCAVVHDPSTLGGVTLAVIRGTVGAFTQVSDYPDVARWDRDKDDAIQLIGLGCGAAWCTVGPADAAGNPAFTPSDPYMTPTGTSAEERVKSIKGWYDEQVIAANGTATPRPSGIHADVFPAPDLGSHRDSADFVDKFIPVSYVALARPLGTPSAHYGTYKKKFNFDPKGRPAALSAMTEIAICKGTEAGCRIPTTDPHVAQSCGGAAPAAGEVRWWSRLTSRNGPPPVYRCVTRRAQYGVGRIPATARWRWLWKDETTWQECAIGCCEVNGT